MVRLIPAMALCAALMLHSPLARAAAVQSAALKLELEDATGAVISLAGADGREYLNGKPTPLFRLLVTDAESKQHWLDAGHAAACETASDTGDGQCALTFEDIRFPGLSATARIRPQGEMLLLKLEVSNEAGVILEEILFPDLALRPQLGDKADDDCILAPWGDGVVLTRKAIDRIKWSPTRSYPGQCSMQFCAAYDDHGGLCLSCRDSSMQCKAIGYEKRQDALLLRLSIRRPYVRDVSFEGPWYCLAPCRGSWQSAAAAYKPWARRQWWSKAPDSRPQWLKKMPVLLDTDLRPLGNGRMSIPLDQIGPWADAWKTALGAPLATVMLRSWEKDGVYVMPDCLPVYPSPNEFRQVTESLHSTGNRAAAMVAGLKWVIEREAFHTPHYNVTGYEGRELFKREGPALCVTDKKGVLVENEPYFTWDGTKAYMCPGAEGTTALYAGLAGRLASLGLDLFEFDQMNGGGMAQPCYSTDHGHPPGYGPWVAQSIRRMFKSALEAGRAANPDFAITMEETGELYLDLMDTYCGRNHEMATWPAMGEGSHVAPVFTYVYHGVKPASEIDISHSSLAPVEGLPAQMRLEGLTATARNFIWGRMLTTQMRPWEIMHRFGLEDLLPLPHKMQVDQMTLLKNVSALLWGPAFGFMARGELGAPPPVGDVPTHSVTEKGSDGEFIHAEPVVLSSSFELGDGRVAFLYVSTAAEPVSVPGPPMDQEGVWTLYRNSRPGEALGTSMDAISLDPYDAVAIILQP